MTVITSLYDDLLGCFDDTSKCSVCGGDLIPPFAMWCGASALFFCRGCCGRIRCGLGADIAQTAAIAELQSFGYADKTLIRRDVEEQRQEVVRSGVIELFPPSDRGRS